jgi:hypothetical protein
MQAAVPRRSQAKRHRQRNNARMGVFFGHLGFMHVGGLHQPEATMNQHRRAAIATSGNGTPTTRRGYHHRHVDRKRTKNVRGTYRQRDAKRSLLVTTDYAKMIIQRVKDQQAERADKAKLFCQGCEDKVCVFLSVRFRRLLNTMNRALSSRDQAILAGDVIASP